MGIFDFLKKSSQAPSSDSENIGGKTAKLKTELWADSSTIAADEHKYYQSDEYYALITHKGTPFERKVITYEERKKCSLPTSSGLYVAEVLLLEYCSYGKYPKPSSGYPGFWWFKYGIRDVGHALKSLEKRGFLQWCPLEQRLSVLKTDELKQLLASEGLPTSGKKANLIDRIITGIPGADQKLPETSKKHSLTPLGQTELQDKRLYSFILQLERNLMFLHCIENRSLFWKNMSYLTKPFMLLTEERNMFPQIIGITK